MAPDVAGHRLIEVQGPVVDDRQEPVISMAYRRPELETAGSLPAVQVTVRRGSVGTPGQACARPYDEDSWLGGGPCVAAPGDRWVRRGQEGRVAVFTHVGGALIQLESHGVGEEALLEAATTIRPATAETLARHVRPVR